MHNYLADFDSESDLYLRAMRLLEQLRDWQPSEDALKAPHPLAACMEELWVMMYEHGYLQMGDVRLVQAWLHSLVAAGYKFPPVTAQPAVTAPAPTTTGSTVAATSTTAIASNPPVAAAPTTSAAAGNSTTVNATVAK